MPVLVQVADGQIDAEGVVATNPLHLPRGRCPPGGLPLNENGRHREAADPIEHFLGTLALEAGREQQTLNPLSLDQLADLAPVFGRVAARFPKLDVHAEYRRRGARPGTRWASAAA